MQEDHNDHLQEREFDLLIDALITFGERLRGKPYAYGTKNIHLAGGLGLKILHHAISFRHLAVGYALELNGKTFDPQIDFASGFILVRAALETYLTLNHIYITPADEAEYKFRFDAWDYAGYHERLKHFPADPQFQQQYQKESAEMARLEHTLQNDLCFFRLSTGLQEKLLDKGEWRLNKAWWQLAVEAGFNQDYFNQHYRYLCGYAHSNRISVIQIQQVTDLAGQKQMLYGSMGLLMVVLAKHTYDYIHLIPELKVLVPEDDPAYRLVLQWKQIGEQLNIQTASSSS
jgi:hypothetical protein